MAFPIEDITKIALENIPPMTEYSPVELIESWTLKMHKAAEVMPTRDAESVIKLLTMNLDRTISISLTVEEIKTITDLANIIQRKFGSRRSLQRQIEDI